MQEASVDTLSLRQITGKLNQAGYTTALGIGFMQERSAGFLLPNNRHMTVEYSIRPYDQFLIMKTTDN
jgi:hypothetical protein